MRRYFSSRLARKLPRCSEELDEALATAGWAELTIKIEPALARPWHMYSEHDRSLRPDSIRPCRRARKPRRQSWQPSLRITSATGSRSTAVDPMSSRRRATSSSTPSRDTAGWSWPRPSPFRSGSRDQFGARGLCQAEWRPRLAKLHDRHDIVRSNMSSSDPRVRLGFPAADEVTTRPSRREATSFAPNKWADPSRQSNHARLNSTRPSAGLGSRPRAHDAHARAPAKSRIASSFRPQS